MEARTGEMITNLHQALWTVEVFSLSKLQQEFIYTKYPSGLKIKEKG